MPGSIQLAKRPEIRTEPGKVNRLVIKAGADCLHRAIEPDHQLRDAFHDLRELKVNVVTPLLLELYGDYEFGLISRDELLEALRLLEAYVFRRAVCAIPSNSQQKAFATFSRALRREPGHYLPSFKAHLLDLPSYRKELGLPPP